LPHAKAQRRQGSIASCLCDFAPLRETAILAGLGKALRIGCCSTFLP
jgi:hypothetical protein